MRHKNLEPTHHLSEGDTPIALPLLHTLDVVDHDDEVVLLALVVDFGLGGVAAGHGGGWAGGWDLLSGGVLVVFGEIIPEVEFILRTVPVVNSAGEDRSSNRRLAVVGE